MDEMKLQGTGRMDHTTELKKNFRLNHIYLFIHIYLIPLKKKTSTFSSKKGRRRNLYDTFFTYTKVTVLFLLITM